jgi:hypothetical protein
MRQEAGEAQSGNVFPLTLAACVSPAPHKIVTNV